MSTSTLKFDYSGGQFEPAKGGQFQPANRGHFIPVSGGQYHRILQYFTDYYSTPVLPTGTTWVALDPVNAENNIVKTWGTTKVNELAEWFEKARDNWQRIIHFDEDGDDNDCLEELVELFGTPFKNHCDKED